MFRQIKLTAIYLVGSLFITTLVAAPSSSADGAERGTSRFRAIVLANFKKWDRNWDGRLSAGEIGRLVADPEITGEAAAAVAAIHVYLRGDKAPAAVGESELLGGSHTQAARPDENDSRPHFESDFTRFNRHLEQAPPHIFAGRMIPALNQLCQGRLGDCYFVSAVGAAVYRDSDAVRRMIRPHADGSSDVAFPGGPTVHVRRLTDTEIALSSTAGNQGLWLNVLEKAFGNVKLQNPKSRRSTVDLDLDVIARGGDARQSISLLTGHKSRFVAIRKRVGAQRVAPSEDEIPALRKRFDVLIEKAMEDNLLVCAGTPKDRLPPGVVAHHDYAVLGYDRSRGLVDVWNPWGKTFKPRSKTFGLKHGYPISHGRFTLPLDDFLRIFSGVYFETNDPVQSANQEGPVRAPLAAGGSRS